MPVRGTLRQTFNWASRMSVNMPESEGWRSAARVAASMSSFWSFSARCSINPGSWTNRNGRSGCSMEERQLRIRAGNSIWNWAPRPPLYSP